MGGERNTSSEVVYDQSSLEEALFSEPSRLRCEAKDICDEICLHLEGEVL